MYPVFVNEMAENLDTVLRKVTLRDFYLDNVISNNSKDSANVSNVFLDSVGNHNDVFEI